MPYILRLATLAAVIAVIAAYPHNRNDLQNAVDQDMESVGSYVRVVRATRPVSYHITHEDDGSGELGYSQKKEGGGKKGYQKFDSFHKKAGDNYEFEKADSYGQDEKGGDEGFEGGHAEKDGKKAQKYVDGGSYEGDAGDDGGYYSTTASEAEAHGGPSGYDEEDSSNYHIPSQYEHGSGDDYNYK